jgi:hypothetical protein
MELTLSWYGPDAAQPAVGSKRSVVGNRSQAPTTDYGLPITCFTVVLHFINSLEAFIAMFAPFCTANVHSGVTYFFFTLITGAKWVVFPELYLITAKRAVNGKDIFRFPHLLILSGAKRHLIEY